ncbi:MAG: hypothetical protein V1725_06760 [archaeon]
MVLSAKETLETKNLQTQQKASKLEDAIDKKLADEYVDETSEVVFPYIPGTSRKALAIVMSHYRQAGWTVTQKHDQREGDMLVFSYKG